MLYYTSFSCLSILCCCFFDFFSLFFIFFLGNGRDGFYTAALHDGRVRNEGRNSVDRRQVLQVMDGDLIWMTLITDAEGGRVNWMVGFVFWFAGWCLIVQFSPGGCLIVQFFLRCGVPRLEQAGGTTESEGPSRTGEL